MIKGIVSVELKAIIKLGDVHFAQAINYLEAINLEIGLLKNFGEISLNFKGLTNKNINGTNHDSFNFLIHLIFCFV